MRKRKMRSCLGCKSLNGQMESCFPCPKWVYTFKFHSIGETKVGHPYLNVSEPRIARATTVGPPTPLSTGHELINTRIKILIYLKIQLRSNL